jgi:hypothetical protein
MVTLRSATNAPHFAAQVQLTLFLLLALFVPIETVFSESIVAQTTSLYADPGSLLIFSAGVTDSPSQCRMKLSGISRSSRRTHEYRARRREHALRGHHSGFAL